MDKKEFCWWCGVERKLFEEKNEFICIPCWSENGLPAKEVKQNVRSSYLEIFGDITRAPDLFLTANEYNQKYGSK